MSQIELFTNDHFRVLSHLYGMKNLDNKVSITQQEIANELGLSRATINRIMGELKMQSYIEQDGNHVGRYLLKDKAISVVETIKKISEQLNQGEL